MCLFTNAVLIGMGALDGKELFAIEGSENWRSTPRQPGRTRKMRKIREKTIHRRHNQKMLEASYPSVLGHVNDLVQELDANMSTSTTRTSTTLKSTATAGPSQFSAV